MSKKNWHVSSWKELELILIELQKTHSERARIAAEHEGKKVELNKIYAPMMDILDVEISSIESAIEAFCRANKKEFDVERSRKFANSIVGFRKGRMVVKELKEDVIDIIKRSKKWSVEFLQFTPKLDKSAVLDAVIEKEITAKQLEKLGLAVEEGGDEFFCKVSVGVGV